MMLGYSLLLGVWLVNAHFPSKGTTFALIPITDTYMPWLYYSNYYEERDAVESAHKDAHAHTIAERNLGLEKGDGAKAGHCGDGCEPVTQAECEEAGGEFHDPECEFEESYACKCETQFVQPSTAFKDTREFDADKPEQTPCGQMQSFKWNTNWNIDGQKGTISMGKKTIANADYFDCIENGGDWRDQDGPNDWEEFSGKHCRTTYDFFEDKGKKRASVDSFLCKRRCKDGSNTANDCLPMDPWPKCTCEGGTAPSKENWRDCLFDGNKQCTSCNSPDQIPVASSKVISGGDTSEILCQTWKPFHLVECGRDPTHGFRIVPKAHFAPYSNEACAYWVKQDDLCAGDYFYSVNHLDVTDQSEQAWPDYRAWQEKKGVSKSEAEWEADKKSFVKADGPDLRGGRVRSAHTVNSQKRQGCWCRGSDKASYLLDRSWKNQESTWWGYAGNTYKFDVSGEDNQPQVGPYFSTDPAKGCNNANYKVDGLTSEWPCPSVAPKPIFGWIVAPATVASEAEGCFAKNRDYLKRNTLYADVMNIPNGDYSVLCYASNLGRYKMLDQTMRSTMPEGIKSVGSKYNHAITAYTGHKDNLCGAASFRTHENFFTTKFTIDEQEREIFFVIRKWKFQDGRMYFGGEEKVASDYSVTEDPRWKKCSSRFTVRAPLTENEISEMRRVMYKTIVGAVKMLKIDCKTAFARQQMKDMAKQFSINGLEYTGEEFWGMWMESKGFENKQQSRKECGTFQPSTRM